MLDKINQQNEQIAAEKDTREIWVNRYELEQRGHIQTHTDLMKLRGQYQELAMECANQKTQIETFEKGKDQLTDQLSKL